MKELTLPIDKKTLTSLEAGDAVSLSGYIYTARDAAHKRICETLKNGGTPPIELNGAVIYYCGPTPALKGEVIGSCGPTTSARMDDYTPFLMEKGAVISIGKGRRGRAVTDAIKRFCGLYLIAVGGAGALIKSCVKECDLVAYPDLGCEAIYRLKVENMQLLVGIDSRGETVLR